VVGVVEVVGVTVIEALEMGTKHLSRVSLAGLKVRLGLFENSLWSA